MWATKLKPITDVGTLIEECVKSSLDAYYKKNFRQSIPSFVNNSELYKTYALAGNLTQLEKSSDFKNYVVSGDDIYNLYDSGLHGRAPGKELYNKYINESKSINNCPFCLNPMRKPELDHFMPRSKFKLFAMEPWNLVPTCKDCNGIKLNQWTKHKYVELFNPYFNIDFGNWLQAEIKEDSGSYTVIYRVNSDPNRPRILQYRMEYHFYLYKLDFYYSQLGSGKLPSICDRLVQKSSCEERMEYLRNERDLEIAREPNSWEGLLYGAMLENQSFIEEGFLRVSQH